MTAPQPLSLHAYAVREERSHRPTMRLNHHHPAEDTENATLLLFGADGSVVDSCHFRGGRQQVILPFRTIFMRALQVDARALLLIHNHPSGDPRPSTADIATTRTLCRLARPLGIRVLDHVIHSSGASFSFRAEGLL